jgi:hypothetical protein
MSEWWTYTLSDFLLFSAHTYYRLFELYNRAVWPAQLVTPTLGIVMLACLWRAGARRTGIAAALLAACWLWVAWAFHLQRYASINWAANYFAIGFAIEALLLIWIGLVRGEWRDAPTRGASHVAGLGVFLFALFIQPLLGPVTGRPWPQAQLFGLAPDPTVIATLGIVLLASNRPRWVLLAIPLLWCAISGATLWAMASPDALLMPIAALLAALLAGWKTLSHRPE